MRTVVREGLFDQQLLSLYGGSFLIDVDQMIQDAVEWTLSRAKLSDYPLTGRQYKGHNVHIFITSALGAMPVFTVLFFSPDPDHVHLLALAVFPRVSAQLPGSWPSSTGGTQ